MPAYNEPTRSNARRVTLRRTRDVSRPFVLSGGRGEGSSHIQRGRKAAEADAPALFLSSRPAGRARAISFVHIQPSHLPAARAPRAPPAAHESVSGRHEPKYRKPIPVSDYQKLIFVPPEGAQEAGGGKVFVGTRAVRRAGRGGTG